MRKFSRLTKHRKSMFRTMCKQLIEKGSLETTLTKAKNLQRIIEKLITKGKEGSKSDEKKMFTLRLVASRLHNDKTIAHKLVKDIAPRFANRSGGYTRVIRSGFRAGDKGEKAIIQILQ